MSSGELNVSAQYTVALCSHWNELGSHSFASNFNVYFVRDASSLLGRTCVGIQRDRHPTEYQGPPSPDPCFARGMRCSMPSKRRKFTAELEDETVKLVLERGLPITQATKDLDESESTLGRWVQKARAEDQGPALRFPDVPEGAGPGRVGRRAIRKLLPPAQAKTTPCHRLDGHAGVGLTADAHGVSRPPLCHALCHSRCILPSSPSTPRPRTPMNTLICTRT